MLKITCEKHHQIDLKRPCSSSGLRIKTEASIPDRHLFVSPDGVRPAGPADPLSLPPMCSFSVFCSYCYHHTSAAETWQKNCFRRSLKNLERRANEESENISRLSDGGKYTEKWTIDLDLIQWSKGWEALETCSFMFHIRKCVWFSTVTSAVSSMTLLITRVKKNHRPYINL